MELTPNDRLIIKQARDVGPELRAMSGDRERLAGWLLAEFADRLEQLAGTPLPFAVGQLVTVTDGNWTGTVERIDADLGAAYVRFPDRPDLAPYAFEALNQAS